MLRLARPQKRQTARRSIVGNPDSDIAASSSVRLSIHSESPRKRIRRRKVSSLSPYYILVRFISSFNNATNEPMTRGQSFASNWRMGERSQFRRVILAAAAITLLSALLVGFGLSRLKPVDAGPITSLVLQP